MEQNHFQGAFGCILARGTCITVFGNVQLADTRRAAYRQHAGHIRCVPVLISELHDALEAQVCIVRHYLDDSMLVTFIISLQQCGKEYKAAFTLQA
jgi:hypothetical protein